MLYTIYLFVPLAVPNCNAIIIRNTCNIFTTSYVAHLFYTCVCEKLRIVTCLQHLICKHKCKNIIEPYDSSINLYIHEPIDTFNYCRMHGVVTIKWYDAWCRHEQMVWCMVPSRSNGMMHCVVTSEWYDAWCRHAQEV